MIPLDIAREARELGVGESVIRRSLLIDSTRSHHHRQERNYAHEEGVRIRAEEKRARRRARNRALAQAGQIGRVSR